MWKKLQFPVHGAIAGELSVEEIIMDFLHNVIDIKSLKLYVGVVKTTSKLDNQAKNWDCLFLFYI